MTPQIVMLGTAPGMRSGIASLVQTYASHGLFQRWDAIYLPTHRDGGLVAKATIAGGAWMDFTMRVATGRVALVHAHLASYASFWRKALLMLPARILGIPYILHLHGGAFVEFYAGLSSPAKRFVRQMFRDAARVIALSPEWRDALAAIEPAAKIEIIPNAIEIPPWQASLEAQPPTVLFLGMLLERKGVRDLLNAWPAVRVMNPQAQLILAGSGDLETLRTWVQESGVESSVRIEGWVEGEAKERLLRSAWMLALPSHVEALPMAVLESLGAGIPVVATRVGGIPTIVEHQRHGLLISPGDVTALSRALSVILTEAPLRKAMGRAGRERALAEFSSEQVVPRVEALWRELAPAQEVRGRVATR